MKIISNNIPYLSKNFQPFGCKEISNAIYKKLSLQPSFPYFPIENKWIAKVYTKKDKHYLLSVSTFVEVTQKTIDIDTNEIRLCITLYNGYKLTKQDFPSDILHTQGIKELLKYGVRYEEKMRDDLIRYLMISEQGAPIKKVYTSLGWHNQGDKLRFKGASFHTKKGVLKNYAYGGKLLLTPKGDFEQWVKMVNTELIEPDNIPLQFILALGFSGPILSLMNDEFELGSVIFSISGYSSKGKTTSAILATSAFSCPVMDKGTLISYYSTSNGLIKTLENCNGMTVAIDEAATNPSKGSADHLLYTMAAGVSKRRMEGSLKLQDMQRFSSIILSTAEFNLLNERSPDGLRARVFEIDEPLTRSAESSNIIKNVALNNYGHAGGYYLKHLVKQSCSDIKNKYTEGINKLVSISEHSDLSYRMATKLSAPVTAVEYFNEAFEGIMQLNYEKILYFNAEIINRNANKKSPEEKLLNLVFEDYAVNGYKYAKSASEWSDGCIGIVKSNMDYTYICVLRSYFEKLMETNSIANSDIILRALKKQGLLDSYNDHLCKKITIKKQQLPFYIFIYKNQEKD